MRLRSAALAAVYLLGAVPARAEPPEAGSAPAASATHAPQAAAGPPSAAAIADAKTRFRQALELHDEGNLDAARTELKRAYETAPNFKVLFNLAQVEFELLDYPAALMTFEKYLVEGGDRIPKERRAQVRSDIEKLRARLGSIEIAVNVTGARVAIDDVVVGTTPLVHPVLVSAGRRRITVSHTGLIPETRSVDVGSGDQATMSFELTDGARAAGALPAAPSAIVEMPAPTSAPFPETPAPASDAGTKRSVPWLGWVATAVLASGAGVTGALALERSSRLGTARARLGTERSELDDLQKEAAAFALASDICVGSAAFAGILSLYLTLSSGGEHKASSGAHKDGQRRSVRIAPALGFVSVEGSF